MANNRIGTGERIVLVAGANRTSGVPAVDENIAGVPETTVLSGARYASKVEGEYEVPFIANCVKGDRVDINLTTGALTRVAAGGAVANGTRAFAHVTAVPGNGPTADANTDPKTGRMWIKLLPQTVSWTA
jgi:hypothetical protein